MANPPKKKGTAYEGEVLRALQAIWPEAHRSSANTFSCDIVGTPLDAVETKHCKTWLIPEWVRKLRRGGNRWALFVAPGDRRRADSPGEIVVFDRAFALELLEAWAVRGLLAANDITVTLNTEAA